jgi:epoxide hydrolase
MFARPNRQRRHCWPSSPFEFIKIIGPLTDPRAHDGDPGDAFDVVIPSLPGYGFSTPVTAPGAGNPFRVAAQWAELMTRLGYRRFAVQGTDVGTGVAGMLAMIAGDRVIGVHLTGTTAGMPFGPALDVNSIPVADRERAERFNDFRENGLGYLHIQATKPQTLSYALTYFTGRSARLDRREVLRLDRSRGRAARGRRRP